MSAAVERITITAGGRTIPLEIFPRASGERGPAVLVLSEIFGLNDDIRRIARRFAANGYLAAAPDFLAGGWHLGCVVRAARDLRAGEGATVAVLEAAIDAVAARQDVARVGVVGFCMGGGYALLLGTRVPLGAAGVFYGDVPGAEALARACPIVGGYGGRDRIFAPQGRRLIAGLDALGRTHDVVVYENAGHSYMNDAGHPLLATLTRPLMAVAYDAAAAEDSWRRMLAFFARHLVEAPQG
ncbi:MAG: dienelactone hydrolase family protein [Deltaproteobacteria bacterium]|nr:dienelactone hydrolase family protein [Deltaproteobacteria bacterium]